MKHLLNYKWLIGILFLAFVLRFFGSWGKYPLGPDWDEAALGYNAYSMLKNRTRRVWYVASDDSALVLTIINLHSICI